MDSVSFTVEGEPVPKKRPRVTKSGHTYTPKETVQYEEAIAWACLNLRHKFEPGQEIRVTVRFFCSERPRQKLADIDNLLKGVLDGVQMSGVIKNDRDVAAVEASRHTSTNPRTEVTIEHFTEKDVVHQLL